MQSRIIHYLSIAFFACALLWGVYTLLVFVGVPIHQAVLLTEAGQHTVANICGNEPAGWKIPYYLCSGAVGIGPFLLHTIGRAGPFLWYAVISVIGFAAFVGWQYLRNSSTTFTFRWRPWKFLLLCLGLLWLLFTVLSFGTDRDRPVRLYLEPTTESYNVSAEGLTDLRNDYQRLLNQGCLSPLGETQGRTKVYMLRVQCIQISFFTRVMPHVFFVLLWLFEFLVLGRALLWLLRYRPTRPLVEAVLSVALGVCAWIALLWFLAVFSTESFSLYQAQAGWAALVLVPAACYRHVVYWLRQFIFGEWESEWKWYDISLLLGWLLLSYVALNFLMVVRPFPIGWDDLGSYLNRPRMLVSYGHFIHSMSPFEWGYLTSLGFLLFGFQSTFGATVSMMVNWTAGLLAIVGVFTITNLFLGRKRGFWASLLYYSLPLVGHFSFADMKIDNAVFFLGSMGIFATLLALFPVTGDSEQDSDSAEDPVLVEQVRAPGITHDASPASARHHLAPWQLFVLAGIFGGFAFATKPTAVMAIMAMGTIIAGALLAWPGFLSALFGGIIVFMKVGGVSLGSIVSRIIGTNSSGSTVGLWLFVLCLAVGAAGFGYAFWKHRMAFWSFVRAILLVICGLAISIAPWVIHNNILVGNVVPQLLFGAPNTISPSIALDGRDSVRDIGQDIRFLPPELKLDRQHPTCNATGSIEELDRYWGFSNGWAHYLTLPWRSVMNIDAVGYYVTTIPALLLFPLVLLLPYTWSKRGRWLRWLALSTVFMLVQWMFLANGIPWYGISVFLGLVVVLEALVAEAPDLWSKGVVSVLLGLSLFSAFAMRFWQFEQQRSILEFSFGKVNDKVLEELTIPHYNDITQVVLQRRAQFPQRPYLYRVGTFIPYFIPKNLEMIGINDHQLDVFNCLFQERNPALTVQRFKALGFNSIIFDTNTATIEKDPNGSLHKKVAAFEEFVNSSGSKLNVPLNDPNAGVAYIEIP